MIGVTLMGVAILEGYVGYSLLDDLLSGMGLAIGNGAALSIPGAGGALGSLIWDGAFPGGDAFLPRLLIVHVFVLPALIAVLIAVEAAFAFLLLAGSGLMIRSLIRLQEADHGIHADNVLTMRLPIGSLTQTNPRGKYQTKPRQMV